MGRVPKARLTSLARLSRLALLALATAPLLAASPAHARPIDEELRNLVVEHPLLKSTRLSVESADKSRAAARSGYYPRVSLSADAGRESITTQSYSNGNVTPPIDTDLNRRKAGLVVEQNLYAGGRTEGAVAVAGLDMQLQQSNLQSTTQEVLLEGVTAYVQIARYLTLASLARRNEETTQQQLELETSRVERGGGIAVDAMAARGRLQLVKERRVFYAQGLREAMANYQQVFGHEPDIGRLQQVGIFQERIPRTLDEALAQARDMSPRLKEALLQSQKAQAQIGIERAANMPSVDLVASHLRDRNANALARRDESSLLLRMNWPLFSGFETQNRVAAASANHQSLVEREAAVNNRLAESVRVAWNQLTNGREREELLESAAGISYDVMQSRKRLRDAGRETVIFVLDAEVEYYGALSNRINAMHDSVLASYRLLAAMGALTPAALGLEGGSFALPLKPFNPDAAALLR
jgi:adhesin transport system outer membrane protein